MKIAVINGSPKGDNSVTLQTILYLKELFCEHEFCFLNAAARIHYYEKDFSEAAAVLGNAELILFSYPVYTFMVPSQLHRFMELMKQEIAEGRLKLDGKYASQFSTSKHFYDVTAHTFIEENCEDMGLRIIRGLSADMEDLTTKKGQQDAQSFFRYLLWNMGEPEETVSSGSEPVVIVADLEGEEDPLTEMIARFQNSLQHTSKVVNLREFPFHGGCLGCLRCSTTGICVYNDGFDRFLREEIQSGAAIVYAFTIRDHSMGARFKMYDDRQFCNGHRTVTMGSPVGYLIHGAYEKETNLKMILEARAETGGNFFAGAAADENGGCLPDVVNRRIQELAAKMDYSLRHQYAPPSNFYGVGGMKIFRDLIYQMRGFMKADHRFFKEHGQYDFPQKKRGTILLMYLAGAMFSNEKMRKKLGNKINEGMLMPYRKVLQEQTKKTNKG